MLDVLNALCEEMRKAGAYDDGVGPVFQKVGGHVIAQWETTLRNLMQVYKEQLETAVGNIDGFKNCIEHCKEIEARLSRLAPIEKAEVISINLDDALNGMCTVKLRVDLFMAKQFANRMAEQLQKAGE